MAEAVMVHANRGWWYRIRAFVNKNLVNIFAGGLFTLLAIFIVYPIFAVLIKSFWGDDGFTLDFYAEFFNYNFYYWSLINTLVLGFSTMGILLVVGFVFAYLTTRGPYWLRKPLKMAFPISAKKK